MKIFDPNYLNLEYFFNLLYRFFVEWLPAFFASLAVLSGLRIWLLVLSLGLAVLVIILVYRIADLRRAEVRDFVNLIRVGPSGKAGKNQAWEKVLAALASDNPADWKQAIIEADIMLDEMVKAMNYPGDGLGERLKSIEPSDFLTLQDAWEAHKVRNQIAHDSNFILTRREASRTLDRFKRVFDEFGYI